MNEKDGKAKIAGVMGRLGLLLALSASGVTTALAGGLHYNVSVGSLLYTDDNGQLAGVQMNWLHDPDVSAIIIDGRDLSAEGLLQIGDDMLADVAEVNYFTTLTVNGQPLALGKAQLDDVTLNSDQALQLSVTVPLQQPIAVAGKTLGLRLTDPEGTAILSFANAQLAALDEDLQTACSAAQLTEQAMDMNGHQMKIQTANYRCQ